MFWKSLKPFNIARNNLGRSMVVVHDRVYTIANAVVCLSYPNVQGEEEVDEGEDEEMQLIAEEASYTECGSRYWGLILAVIPCWWEIWLLA